VKGGSQLTVGVHVKVAEKCDHGEVVGELEVGELPIKDFLVNEAVDCVGDAEEELNQLHVGDPLLEGIVEAKGGPEVVRVHDKVHNGVEEGAKVGGADGLVALEEVAPDKEDGGVVVHMEEGELPEVPLEDHDPGVKEVEKLAQVVHKHEPLDLRGGFHVGGEGVVEIKAIFEEAPGHVPAEDDLGQVVELGEAVELELRCHCL